MREKEEGKGLNYRLYILLSGSVNNGVIEVEYLTNGLRNQNRRKKEWKEK